MRPVQNMIMALQVRCPERAQTDDDETNKGAGVGDGSKDERKAECCDWEGTLSDYLDKHKNKTCKFRLIACPLGCAKMVPIRKLETHKAAECEHRSVGCSLCEKKVRKHMLERHLRSECPLAEVSCKYCKMKVPRKDLGKEPSDYEYDDLPGAFDWERKYSGHYRLCPRIPVKCDFYHHGCTQPVHREILEAHHAKNGRRHAQLVAFHVKRLEDEKEWHSKEINWRIKTSQLEHALYHQRPIQESQSVMVGPYQAFVRLAVINGEIRLFVCVEESLEAPDIDELDIHVEGVLHEQDFDDIDLVGGQEQTLGWVDIKEKVNMKADGSGNGTWTVGGTVKCTSNLLSGVCDNVTRDDVLQWCNNNERVTVRASFRLRSPDSIDVDSKDPSSLRISEGVWGVLERN